MRVRLVLLAAALLFCAQAGRAQVRVSSLPTAVALTGTELVPIVQGGANVVTTPAAIKTYTGGGGGSPGGASGQLQYNNAGAFGGFAMAGDCTLSQPNITCTKTSGTPFGTFATQNYAAPPAIGGTTPAAGTFTTLTSTSNLTVGGNIYENQAAGTNRNLIWQSSGSNRWDWFADAVAEGGSNAGSGLHLSAFADDGVTIVATPFIITRATGSVTMGSAGAASAPGLYITGAPYAGGSTTTNFPQLLLEPGAATAGVWSASGTALGVDMHSGAIGNLVDLQLDGTSKFSVTSAGVVASAGAVNGITNTSATAYTFTGTAAQTYTFPTTSATIARTDAAQTFTGVQTFSSAPTTAAGYTMTSTALLTMSGTSGINTQNTWIENSTSTCSANGGASCVRTAGSGSLGGEFTLSSAGSATTMTITPGYTAAHGFECDAFDATTTTERLKQTAVSATGATLTFYNDAGTATSPGASDVIWAKCVGL